jgi:diaminohydroxyphosphoribosylaminopyrimidine deaminase / 5-amino-6-(5-phosphoribosylamino)uracil reductase
VIPEDHLFMAQALRLARLGLYTTHPNPRVGCVLVKEGRVIGEGWHRRAGEPHAERNALAQAGAEARGSTAYVTLEPCSHHGRTPPCSDGLIEAGVSRVVAAMADPNPLVAGQGFARLRAAGIAVESGLLEAEAEALNPGFLKRMRLGIPFVRCKLAMSLDGRTALESGESKWITEPAARRDVQRWRAQSSAIVTGIGTVLADDPSLDVRMSGEELGLPADLEAPRPLRVVLDSTLRMPLGARMLGLPGQTLVIGTQAADSAAESLLWGAGAQVARVASRHGQVDLTEAIRLLAQWGVNEVLLECGQTLAGAALEAGLVDELLLYVAPHLLGHAGRALVRLPSVRRMDDRVDLKIKDLRLVGRDIRILAEPEPVV